MTVRKKIAILISFCFFTAACLAQPVKAKQDEDRYRAVHWTAEEGLAKERWHTAMLKDVNGFLWVGSNHGEVSRFDGNSFQQYVPDQNKPGSIRSNNCLGFTEDSMHNIWIGTARGLSRYDIMADTFTNFVSHADSELQFEFAIPFWATRNKLFYIEADAWIAEYDTHSFAKKRLVDIRGALKAGKIYAGIPGSYSVFDSASNSIWMLTAGNDGLAEISLGSGKIIYHIREPYKKTPYHNDAEAMYYDRKRNCIWINSHDGLTEFTLKDQQFHHIDALNPLIKLPDYERFVGIDIDPQGRIWFATAPKGIIIYDPVSDSVTEPVSNSTLQQNIAYGNIKIYCDRDGIVWTSFWSINGIYQLIPFSNVVHRYTANTKSPDSLTSMNIQNMVAGPHGSLWVGTPQNGLNIYNPETGSFKIVTEKDLPGIKGKGIVPMVIDTARKKAWLNVGPPDMVYEMDIETKKCRPLIFNDSNGKVISPVNIINNVSVSCKGGLLFLDGGYGIFEVSKDSLVAKLAIPVNTRITGIFIGYDNTLFVRTELEKYQSTFRNINNKWIKSSSILDSLLWNDLYYNKTDKSYWVGLYNEIIHFDKDFRKIRSYTNEDGLISTPLSILPDGKGNIWFNNDRKNIASLNIKTGILTALSSQDGYRKQTYDWSNAKGIVANGELYFTGNSLAPDIGLDRISPDRLILSPQSVVYVKSLKISQKSYPLSIGVNNLQKLSLRYFENKISIETGIINHYAKGKSRIRYKLDKLDSNWQYAPYYYTIRYEELPAGEYTLMMQASNAGNEFNGPIKTLFIKINPALWNTWWFRVMAIILLGFAFYGLIRWRLQQKFRLQLERSENERQIVDIKQKATELEMQALRAQMNPHFIFNSLNSINRFILQNNRAQASEYLTKFSKLVRMILQNSQSSFITLESELESLGLYLEMEALRFNYHFDYKISLPKDLDIEVLKVPPLILQPYVENAIWHGLMHKEEKGQLDIDISQKDDHLFFKVIDNGIGRRRASELASKSATKHKSMGLRITAHRIAMMQNSNGLESPVKINDLVEPDGTAAGTEVIIKMPVIYD